MSRAMTAVHCGLVLSLLCLALPALGAGNIYPDPGFEATGTPGPAHSGASAGALAVGARNHWAAIGGGLAVEPFARYRVTEWVRGSIGAGSFFAPYCYNWDSYEWAFVSFKTIQTMGDWGQTEVSFVSPTATMYVHPLAYIDAENCQAWVDDVVVAKIAEPAQVIAELEAQPNLNDDGRKLLARWYADHGRTADAAKLMEGTAGLTRADIATVIAKSIKDPSARRPYVVAAVAAGGPNFNEGVQRFREMTAGMTDEERLATIIAALQANPDDNCARAAQKLMASIRTGAADGQSSLAEEQASVDQQKAAITSALATVPADSAAAKELQAAMTSVNEASARIEGLRSKLGHCQVRLGGKLITRGTHAIIVPVQPTPSEVYAAHDLRRHLELITGEALPIWSERDAANATPIFVGKCDRATAAGVDLPGLGTEGIAIKTDGPALILAGNQRGVVYAVSSFLEDNLGCRWFTPDCSTWPTEGSITIPSLERRYIPPLEFRAGDYPVIHDADFAAHCRLTGMVAPLDERQGGTKGVAGLAHTFAALCPPERYFATHPEYFSLVNGKRQSGYAQLCLTNPDVLRICVDGVRQWIGDNPKATVFSVSQNDTANYCECENCRKIAEDEGSESGPMIRFVNAVADAIAKDHPDVAIETLAYQYTRKPPKITKPRPNVIVCLCSIECCFIHPLGDDPFNKSFVDDIKGWGKICKRLWIWDYIINYAHSICPFPNLYVLKPNIDFFMNNGVTGIYEESCYYTKGSEMQELRNYIISKSLWDPAYDTDKAIDEFCTAYYGPSARFVREYINLIHSETQKDPKLHVQIYTAPSAYVTPTMIARANELFDQAEAAAAGDPVVLHRVQVARLPIMYAEAALSTGGTFSESPEGLVRAGGTDVSALLDRFAEIARAEGVTQVREGGADAGLDAWLQSVPRKPSSVAIERLHNDKLSLAVLPSMGGRIWRMQYAEPGGRQRDILRVVGLPNAIQPSDGGYEEYTEGGYHSPGWWEDYKVTARTDRSLTLEATLRNGLRVVRKLELVPDSATVTITTSLTNTTDGAVTACLRTHPEFSVTSTQTAKVLARTGDGGATVYELANGADPTAEKDQFLRGEDVPAGAWTIVDPDAGLSITDTFLPGTIDQCLLNRAGAKARVNLEMYTPSVRLAPGQTLSFAHSLAISSPAPAAQ
jgi:hypothetical protein